MNVDRKNRRSFRLKGYDYSRVGRYFVTICTKDKEPLFGAVNNGLIQLTRAGEIAVACWKEIPEHFTNIELDEFIVMPDHIHGILEIVDSYRRDVQLNIPTDEQSRIPTGDAMNNPMHILTDDYFSQISPKRGTLKVVVQTYKAAVTTICRQNGIGEFEWQRRYHDHIIRDADSLFRIRHYIRANPFHWTPV